jgi:hypothetical protein
LIYLDYAFACLKTCPFDIYIIIMSRGILPIVIVQVVVNPTYRTATRCRDVNAVDADVDAAFNNWTKLAARAMELMKIDDEDRQITNELVKGQLRMMLQMVPVPTPPDKVSEVKVAVKTPIVEIDFIVQLRARWDDV